MKSILTVPRATVVLAVIASAGCTTSAMTTPTVEPEAKTFALPPSVVMRELTVGEKAILADSFASGLNDPESAKFKWTEIPKDLSATARSFDYCALVNVKNSSDKFSGEQPFLGTIIVSGGVITGGSIVAINTENKPENRNVIPRLCQQKGLDPVAAK
jgi:hypothetical protein